MSQKQTVIVNGREYDARTGLPVEAAHTSRDALRANAKPTPQTRSATKTSPVRHAKSAQHIHQKTQKSKTLNRKFIKKPTQQSAAVIQQKRTPRINSPQLQQSTRKTSPAPKLAHAKKMLDVKPTSQHTVTHMRPVTTAQSQSKPADIHRPHPVATRAHQIQATKKTSPTSTTLPSASAIKQAVINEALEQAPNRQTKQHKIKSRKHHFAGIVFGCLALVMFAGYLTYLNVPNISVRVAAAQAGIDATYPSYQPDGYRLNGPVAYSDGQVQMKFAATTGTTSFTLKQSKSSWDSSALLENYVREKSDDNYSTSQEKGITIYNYGSNAAWVSGGILYTIDGDAPLSPDQIRKIATSV